jgi:hypothetical protein
MEQSLIKQKTLKMLPFSQIPLSVQNNSVEKEKSHQTELVQMVEAGVLHVLM